MKDIGDTIGGGVILVIFLAIFLIPEAKIIRKAGYSKWWAILGIIPLVNVVALWIFAFSSWPVLPNKEGLHDAHT